MSIFNDSKKITEAFTNLKPFWTDEEVPDFISRTDTKYSSCPLLDTLEQRGLDNRLLTSLAEFLPEGAFIGGGFLTSIISGEDKAKDIDFFFTSPKAFEDTYNLFENPPEDSDAWGYQGYTLETKEPFIKTGSNLLRFVSFKHKNENRPDIQLIKLVWYKDVESIIDSFDFTIVQFVTNGKDLYFNPLSFIDVSRKRLVLHRMQFPSSSLQRLVKYSKKGFYACPGALTTICESIMKYTGDKEQIVYID